MLMASAKPNALLPNGVIGSIDAAVPNGLSTQWISWGFTWFHPAGDAERVELRTR
jgi:hypothetical protein